ncbi:nickel-type superoxide dismutase maturation protease [Streptomyces sp. WAC05374]|uniref:nickel-type superoxide dismutase maturation protease n=1 Tax=Streptomyces sp. WAC05374 TaxID=2487420 RepID=UPI000F85CDFD|nr:nickel-type superoxide dismutase maturation protease [Streptomyces sp. WAC05374]RST18449.1 nickel-type superoxide dismutase maturation protease [Streptomyces sp. WAC05374]TDF42989.1 nickel-type superoxide dismutase maturation protease [Streptomyces sp. WAC05374]TDF46700.1 nickel-type superoxide dismutase maturation protease [Streptomyces sp. WAC05374]TDF48894.1 nickel-type superoxide dismutase maturation protease [Streptomyces sp. WAC05374]
MTEQGRERERGPRVPFGVAEVSGPSMVPTLHHGDQLLVHYGAPLKPGQVAVLRHPLQQDLLIVKRLVERRDGGWWVLGDNGAAEAVDSRAFGPVPEDLVLGRVRARYRGMRPGRQRSAGVVLSWLVSAVRPVFADRSVSRRLRAR